MTVYEHVGLKLKSPSRTRYEAVKALPAGTKRGVGEGKVVNTSLPGLQESVAGGFPSLKEYPHPPGLPATKAAGTVVGEGQEITGG